MMTALTFDLGMAETHRVRDAEPEIRREPRFVCQGEVRLYVDDDSFLGELVDVSNLGFRVAHNQLGIAPGDEMRFQHKFFVGKAKVVWTKSVAGRIETGFAIVRG